MTALLICGSRDATPEMQDYAERAVCRAFDLNWRIIVGDAEGIDDDVICACQKLGMNYCVYGISSVPRHWGHAPFERVPYIRIKGDYLARDRHMVSLVTHVLAIWNGMSHGTIYTYNYALKQGKTAWLKTFAGVPA